VNAPTDARLYVDCPQCGFPLTLVAEQLGKRVTCDNCLEKFAFKQAPAAKAKKSKSRKRASEQRSSEEGRPQKSVQRDGDKEKRRASKAGRVRSPGPKPKVLEKDYEFTVECPICSTRLDITDEQIGRKIKCVDCHSRYTIREPSASRRRKKGSLRPEDEELRLSPPIDRPPVSGVEGPVPSEAEGPTPMIPVDFPDTGRVFVSTADEALQKAEEESREAQRPRKLPARPLIDGITTFLFDVGMLVRCIMFAAALQIEVWAIKQADANAPVLDGLSHFASSALSIFSILFGVLLGLAISVTGLTLLRETAGGNDRVETWPRFDAADWFVDSLFIVASLTGSLLLGCIIGRCFAIGGPAIYANGFTVACIVSLVLAFPPMLLSALDSESPIQFASVPVWRGLFGAVGTWIRFTLMSGFVGGTAFLIWRLREFETMIGNFAAALAVMVAVFTFFWLLGRLAWASYEASPEPAAETV
jgi:DNA-directed RNA polymerase subunit M/transcription elongation factor TFIIS